MTLWCSGRGGSCAAGGLGFESRRLRIREFYAKNAEDGWALAGGGLHQLKKSFFWVKIPIFLGFFRFQLCRVSVADALFAECSTRQSLCRVQIGLCRVPLALGKASESGSELNRDKQVMYMYAKKETEL